MKLRVGEICYANLFPVFQTLKQHFDCSQYDFIQGVPSDLNRMLWQGTLDVSPSSSVEYLMHPDRYEYIPGQSVSSIGASGSILLFSKYSLKELEGKTVSITSHSATSALLLKVIFDKFEGIRVKKYIQIDPPNQPIKAGSGEKALQEFDACLLIGDSALRENRLSHKHVYDLGTLWSAHTGLPFVYALWTVRKNLSESRKKLVQALTNQVIKAGYLVKFSYPALAPLASQSAWMSEADLIRYWENLSYELTNDHLKSMELFKKLLSTQVNELKVEGSCLSLNN